METIEVVPNIPAEEVQKFYRASEMLAQAQELVCKACDLLREVRESGRLSISIDTISIESQFSTSLAPTVVNTLVVGNEPASGDGD